MTADELREKLASEFKGAGRTGDVMLWGDLADIAIKSTLEAAIDICRQEASDNQTAQQIASRLNLLIPESAE